VHLYSPTRVIIASLAASLAFEKMQVFVAVAFRVGLALAVGMPFGY
jgi:hypothetical protein